MTHVWQSTHGHVVHAARTVPHADWGGRARRQGPEVVEPRAVKHAAGIGGGGTGVGAGVGAGVGGGGGGTSQHSGG
eukprot:gene8590-352_t